MTPEQLAWVAGIFEGEGTITKGRGIAYRLAVGMTDEDVVRRLHALTGVGQVYHYKRLPPAKPDFWLWHLTRTAQVEKLLVEMLPLLGHRRSAKAEEALAWIRREGKQSHFMTDAEKRAVVQEWVEGNRNLCALARNHGVSRTRVRQLLDAADVGFVPGTWNGPPRSSATTTTPAGRAS